MVWYDFAIAALLVYTMWSGAQRGFITQLAWIAALVLCFKFADKLAPTIEPQINVEQPLKHWIAMLILYLAFSLGSFMVARILNSWMEKAKFKDFDRHLGGLLGLLKGGVIAMVITFFAVTLSESLQATVMKSYSGRAACYVLDHVEPITPDHFQEYLQKYREGLGESVHEGHIGNPATIDDLLGLGDSAVTDSGVPMPQDNGFGLQDIYDGLTNSGSGGQPASGSGADGYESISDLLRRIPVSARDQLQQRWMQSTPEERRSLLEQVNGSLDNRIPGAISDFLAGSSTGQGRTTQPQVDTTDMLNKLKALGDLYRDRDYIVNQALSHFEGVPVEVQQAVIDDWYADWTRQRIDPDPATSQDTTLDVRILSQVNKRELWGQLSQDLRRRLNRAQR